MDEPITSLAWEGPDPPVSPELVRDLQSLDDEIRDRFLRLMPPKKLRAVEEATGRHLAAMNRYIAVLHERIAALRPWEPLIDYAKLRWEQRPESLNGMAESKDDERTFKFGVNDRGGIDPSEFIEFAIQAHDFALARTFQWWNVAKRPPRGLRVKLSIEWADELDAVEISATTAPLTLDGLNRVRSFTEEGEK